MGKQKQIEEMAREIGRVLYEECLINRGHCDYCECKNKETEEYDCQNWLVAKKLLEKYQPKIPENAVVLSREEYDEFLRQNFIIDVLKDCIKDARKETSEKIMNEISGDILTISTRDYGSIEVVPLDRISEICENMIKGDKQ